MRMSLFSCLLLCAVCVFAAEKQTKSRVIDVGDIEIDGEVRRPFVQLLDSDQNVKRVLPDVTKSTLVDFETRMLEFQKPKSKAGGTK